MLTQPIRDEVVAGSRDTAENRPMAAAEFADLRSRLVGEAEDAGLGLPEMIAELGKGTPAHSCRAHGRRS